MKQNNKHTSHFNDKTDRKMPNYRRAFIQGGTWFFTVNLLQRHGNDLLVREIDLLWETVRNVRKRYPFQIDAWVVLPEHLHCVLTLPPNDSDFSLLWRFNKSGFSRALPKTERRFSVRRASNERGIWQRRFWEHYIRDTVDYQRHVDYVHVNPLKHGPVKRVQDWPHSTFHHYVKTVYILWTGAVIPVLWLPVICNYGATMVKEMKRQTCATMRSGCCLQQVERLIECLCSPDPHK